MAARSLNVSVLVMFVLINPIPTLSVDPFTQQLIDKVCRQMEEYGFCNKTFNENLKTPSTDYFGLTEITIEQATINSTNTHDFILQLLDDATEPQFKDALATCENTYSAVQNSFQDAFKYFNQKDYDSMLKSERITPRALWTCDTAIFSAPPNPPNPLVDRNRQMRILIAMAIVTGYELVLPWFSSSLCVSLLIQPVNNQLIDITT